MSETLCNLMKTGGLVGVEVLPLDQVTLEQFMLI